MLEEFLGKLGLASAKRVEQLQDRVDSVSEGTVRNLQRRLNHTAVSHGWHTGDPMASVWKMLGNITGEVSEAWEIARMPGFDPKQVWYKTDSQGNQKPEGFGMELADVVIRALDTAEVFGIDLQKMILEKDSYNSSRPYRHGGKRA